MCPVELPQVPDTKTARLICDSGWRRCVVVALRAVEAGTQGLLGSPVPYSVSEILRRSQTIS